MKRLGIVGGGLLGLTLALRLARAGRRVTVLEAAAGTGGLAAPARIGSYQWDRFYHVVLRSDSELLALLGELDLAEAVCWRDTRTGFYVDGRFHSLSSSMEFLGFPPLGLLDKARLAATILRASRIEDGAALERIGAEAWLRRWSGDRAVDRIWLPLLRAKLGQNYRIASAAFIWAIIRRMYAARRSGLKREQLGHIRGGYAAVLTRLSERLAAAGVEVRCGAPVTAVASPGPGVMVTRGDGSREHFDAVVLTVPTSRVPAICPGLSAAETDRLGRVVYQGVVCASLLLTGPLGPYYVTNITDAWVPFTGVIEMTAVVDPATFGGHSLVYLPRYLSQDDPFWRRSDAEIETEFLDALARMYPGFSRGDVAAFTVARAREVQAVATLDYTERALPPLRTSLDRVFMVNSAQIVNGTLNVNETVRLANRQAAALAEVLP